MRTQTRYLSAGSLGAPSPQRIRWGAVFGGAVIGIALLAMLSALWFALGYGAGADVIRANIEWYVGASAIASLFVAGLLAGWLSGVHGAGSGFFNGLAIWALMVVLTIVAGVPATINVLSLGTVTEIDTPLLEPAADTVLWATFLAIAVGLVASGLGGALGGMFARPANADLVDREIEHREMDHPARPDVEERTVVVPDGEDEAVERRDETVRYQQRTP
ncbi:MAG TPA: hypothetical protein VF129_02665 [Actinomycetota bacterium]